MLEELLGNIGKKLCDLKLATSLLLSENPNEIAPQLSEGQAILFAIRTDFMSLSHELEAMREQNAKLSKMIETLTILDENIVHLTASLPEEVLQEFIKLNEQMTPHIAASSNKSTAADDNTTRQCNLTFDDTACKMDTPEPTMENCKKTLFKNVESSYSIDLLSNEEFAAIPKYIIGRQSLKTLNEFVASINQILEAKYGLLALGKAGARKKGKLDLYLSLQRDEVVVAPGEDPIYFFTAEDYYRHTQMKLDKMKLNLLTALRHCKRLREFRAGKTLKYILMPS